MVFTADLTSKTFRYLVQAADEDTDGIGIPRAALSLNGGTKRDRTSGAAAILDLGVHAVTNDANHQVDGDRVGSAPTFASGLPAGLTYTAGRRVDPATSLPAAAGGEGTLRYALTGPGAAATLSLPAGLTYGAPSGTTSGGTIGGTPTAGAAAATYTLTATDRDGDAGTHRFAVVVHADASPTFSPRTWTAQRYRKNVRVTTAVPGGTDLDYVALPAATGGDGTLRYGLAPALPAGLTYTVPSGTTDGGRIAGTPTGIAAERDYTLTATDADSDQATLTFRLSVADPFAFRFTGTVAEQQYLTGVRVSLALPAAAGGDGTVTYALTPAGPDGRPDLPAGLSFAAATRTIAGTPTETRAKTAYTFTATDAANNRAGPPGTEAGTGLPVVMEVRADTVPTFGSRASVSWPADARVQAALSVNLPAARGGNGTLTYTLSPAAADGRPALPTGLSYTAPAAEDAHGGTIAGTPTAGVASTTHTLTVTDSDANVSAADADTLRFRIAVTDATPTFGTATIPPQRYTQGVAVTTAALPAASGGEGTLAYTVSPGLPSGLTFDAATRVIAGTPLAATPAAPYALVATDDEGTAAASDDDRVSLAFTVAVANAPGGVTVACADPDTATPVLEVDEGRSGTCTAVLNAPPTGDVTVTPSITHVSPASHTTDVTRVPSALTFGTDDWFTARTVTLRAGTDADALNDTATLSFAVGGYGTVTSARAVAIAVRDSETAGLTAAPTSLTLHSGGTATYTLKLDTQPTATVPVDVSGSTAFVTAAPSALTFTGSTWSTAQTVTVAATGVGTTTLTNTAAGGDYAALDTDVAVTVSPDPTLTIGDASVTEGDDGAANLTFTVTLSAASTQRVTVEYAEGTGGTATSGTDYTALAAGTLTFAAGVTSQTVTVAVTGDTTDEPDETVVVTLSSPAHATLLDGGARGTGTITDDDAAPTVTLALSRSSIAESGTTNSATVTASLDHPSSAATTVTVGATAGAGTVAGDFQLSAVKTLTIAAGSTRSTGTVTVAAVDNSKDEATKTVVVAGTAANSQGITQPASVDLTITDDDGAPALSIDSPRVTEGNTGSAHLTFTVTLSPTSGRQVTVGYAEGTGGTATSGTDYTALAAGTLTFGAGVTSQTVTVAVTGDTTDEPDETVVVTLSGPTHATLAEGGACGTGTITDDDAAPTVTLALSRSSIAESGTTNSATVTASLDRPSSAATTVTVGATAGTGTVAGDFQLSAAPTLTIAAGSTRSTGTVTVAAVDNSKDEATKTVVVAGTAANSQGITQPASVDLTITDDDGAPALSIDSPRVTEGNTGSAHLTFTVRLSPASGRRVTVGYAEGTGGTATSGTDYTALAAGTLTFAAGATSRTIAVAVTGDTAEEANETVVMTLSSPTNAVLETATGTGTIIDDDAAPPRPNDEEPPPVPTDSVPSFGARTVEDRAWKQGQEIVAFTLPAATGGDPPVRHDLQPDLPAGVTRTAFQVSGTPTAPVETTTYTWTAADADGDLVRLTFTLAVAECRKPTFTETVPALRYRVGTTIEPLTLPAATGGDAPLTYTLTPPPPPGLTFDAAMRRLSGTPTDPADEGRYMLTAMDADGDAAELTFPLSVAAQAVVSIAGASAMEGGVPAFPVMLSAAVPADVTLTWMTEPGSAQPAADYTPVPARSLTIPAGERTATVMVPTTDDDVAEPEETFTVRLAAAGLPAGVTLGTVAATGTISNDDTLIRVTVETVVYIIDGRRVTVTGLPGIPDGVEIDLPTPLDRDVTVTVAPPAADLPLESARFGLGRQANRRTILDVTVPDVPAGGLTLCLPVRPGLRPEADGQGLALVHYDGNAWERVVQSQDMDGKVCAAGVTDFSPFAVGYERPAESGPNVGAVRGRALGMALAGVGRTAATDAVEVIGTRFARTVPAARANLGGQTLPLHREADAGRWRRAAGVAYGVARALGVEIVSPLGGQGTFGPPGGATWRTLTRTTTDTGTTSAAPEPWGGTSSGERRGMPGDVAWTRPDGMIYVAGYPGGIAQLGFDRSHAAHRARAGAWTLRKPVSFRRISTMEMLSQSAFTAPLSKPDAPGWASGWTLWGRGTAGGFDGEPKDGFSMDGEVFTGYVGLDYRLQQNVLLGLSVAHSRGDVDYEAADVIRGAVDLRLTSVLPYAHWTPRPGLGVWGLLGAGWGDATIKDGHGRVRTDLEMLMAAVGARQEVLTWRQIGLAAKADAFLTKLQTDAASGLPKTAGDAQRVRLALEGRTVRALSDVSDVTPSLEVGGRWDGGKAETGFGAELGGGLEYAHRTLGLGIEARARYLLAHQQSAFDEWGASLTLKLDPGRAKRGLWLTLAPVWGAEASRVEQMWGGAESVHAGEEPDAAAGPSPERFELDLGYGLAVHEGAGLLTTYGGFSIAGPNRRGYRLGGRLAVGESVDLSLESEREGQPGGAEHEVTVHGHLRW